MVGAVDEKRRAGVPEALGGRIAQKRPVAVTLGLLAHDLDAVTLFGEPEQNAAGGLRVAVDLVGERRDAHRGLALAAMAPERLQERDARKEVIAALVAVGEAPRSEKRDRRRDGCAAEDDEPGDVEPKQEHGEGHERAVDRRERARRDVVPEGLAHGESREGSGDAAHGRVRKLHVAVGHELVEEGVGGDLDRKLQNGHAPLDRRRVNALRGGADRLRRDGEREGDHQGPERDERPVEQRPLSPGAHAAHLIDAVDRHEELVNQEKRRHGQTRQTEDAESRGVVREVAQIRDDRLRVLLRQHARDDRLLKRVARVREAREERKGRHRDRDERNERKERRERHRGRHLLKLSLAHAVHRKADDRAHGLDAVLPPSPLHKLRTPRSGLSLCMALGGRLLFRHRLHAISSSP